MVSKVPNVNSPLKVAQVTPLYYPHIGGLERVVQEVAQGLSQRGAQVEILTTEPSPKFIREETNGELVVRRFRSWAPQNAYYWSPAMFRYISRHRDDYDIIHVHNYHALPALMTLMLRTGPPIVLTTHYHGRSASLFRNLLLKIYGLAAKAVLPRASGIICVSEAEAQLLWKDFPSVSHRTRIIPNGIHLDKLMGATPFDLQEKIVLHVGRLESYKNVDMIISALSYLEGYALYIVGDGPEWESLDKLASRVGVSSRVHHLLNLSDDELYRWYRSADVVVNVSRLESFGITAVEAAAAGAPLVLSDIPVFRAFANNLAGTRLVSLECGHHELAQAIREMSTQGRVTRNMEEFSWDRNVEDTLALYDELLKASTAGSVTEEQCS